MSPVCVLFRKNEKLPKNHNFALLFFWGYLNFSQTLFFKFSQTILTFIGHIYGVSGKNWRVFSCRVFFSRAQSFRERDFFHDVNVVFRFIVFFFNFQWVGLFYHGNFQKYNRYVRYICRRCTKTWAKITITADPPQAVGNKIKSLRRRIAVCKKQT